MEKFKMDINERKILNKGRGFIYLYGSSLREYLDKTRRRSGRRDVDFITKSLSTKSNTKNPNIIRQKEIIENWLTENSPSYLRRRSREATKNNYFRAILTYFVLCIHIYNK